MYAESTFARSGVLLESAERTVAPSGHRHRQVSHDLRHGLATVLRLAEVIGGSQGLDQETAERLRSLEAEARRLSQLIDEEGAERSARRPEALIRVDVATREVVEILRGATDARLSLVAEPVSSMVSLTGLWRAVRNLVDNAVRAAGERGRVEVRVFGDSGSAVVEVDDSGPGFGMGPTGFSSLGLGIVQDFVAGCDGELSIFQGTLGGCCVRICLPAVLVLDLVELEQRDSVNGNGPRAALVRTD